MIANKTSKFLSLSLTLTIFIMVIITIPCISAHSGHHDAEAASATPSDEPNLKGKPLIVVKIWCLIIIFLGTLVGGISPYFMKWNEAFLVLGTQFAGGIFLGTALMHFLSDANETFEDLTTIEYPFAFMLACFGYLLTMLADCVIMYVYTKSSNTHHHYSTTTTNNNNNNNGVEEGFSNQKTNHPSNNSVLQEGHETETTNHFANAKLATASSLGDTILLITALCFHSVFEGIAIGVSKTKADAWKALWTISLHKIFAAIAMAIALLRMIPNRPFLSCASYAFAFAISSPVGVAIGIIIDQTTQGRVADWIFAISMGIACGVFVYVSINHLLAKGYSPQNKVGVNTPFYRILAAVFGLGVMAVVMIWDT